RQTRLVSDWSSDVCSSDLAGLDFRVLLPDLLEYPLPQVVSKSHGVRLVAHADALELVCPGVLKGVADDAPDPLARVHILLDRDRSEERRVGKECGYGWAPY